MSSSNSLLSQLGQLFSWVAREHCVRHPEAVAKAWEALTPHAPTLADCGRMYAAYGQDFTVVQLRYLARHPEALSLTRWAAGGWHYLTFDPAAGFKADQGYVSPRPGQASGGLWLFGFATAIMLALSIAAIFQSQTAAAAGCAALMVFCLLLTLVEFVDVRSRHHARRAIALCDHSQSPVIPAPAVLASARRGWRANRLKRGMV
ncbi:hypothetical protein [Cupriavidus basilensis]